MRYLNNNHLLQIGIDWNETISVIENSVRCLASGDFSQPIKPFLRYRDLQNRIIAMPAFVGGDFNSAGIKWVSSFPKNIHRSMPRAHSVVILNNADNGKPVAVINTALLSIIRTASVSGMVLKYFDGIRRLERSTVGIIGWGPIGQYHFKLCMEFLGEKVKNFILFDLKPIDKKAIESSYRDKVIIAEDWRQVYKNSDVFITCTVSGAPYIDEKPKPGALLLNVSLRDFKTDIFEHVKNSIIVDDWDEVCREKTDIEHMHKEKGLQQQDTKSVIDIVCNGCLKEYDHHTPIMFNPMGMAVFDIAIGTYYMKKAIKLGIGTTLE